MIIPYLTLLIALPGRTRAISCNQAVFGASGVDFGDVTGSITIGQTQATRSPGPSGYTSCVWWNVSGSISKGSAVISGK